MKRFLLAAVCLLSSIAVADVEVPTGDMNECGFRSMIASRLVEGQLAGVEEDLVIAGFQFWMANQLGPIADAQDNHTLSQLSMSQQIIAEWIGRVDADGYMDWLQEVYDANYPDPVTAASKERLRCWKELAGELQ